jgi:hypothetical protein
MNLKLTLDEKKACHNCNCDTYVVKKFQNRPCWLFIQNLIRPYQKKLTVFDLPSETFIDDAKYNLLMSTYLNGAHFKSIFKINDRFYSFDDLKPNKLEDTVQKHVVSSCFYYLLTL